MIKDVTNGINYGKKDFQLEKSEVGDLDMNVSDGSTALVVDTYELLIFHNGHWWDGSKIVK